MQPEVEAVRQWIQEAVINLNLCPFARPVFKHKQIRYVVQNASDPESLLKTLQEEFDQLETQDRASLATTLIIAPGLGDFDNFLDMAYLMDHYLDQTPLRGVYQIATFHPEYQFEGADSDSVENYTNRSPLPVFHIIREDDIEQARQVYPDTESIPIKNQKKLKEMGRAKVLAMFARFDLIKPQ
ncbi:DUF1415 domain-containing protein [Pseudobacteriovorax antillogorgiicola]|uniref:DUF1415 domain-containing protein n=1 Tax=Pseudobacteriovorax antillogorgiicola TaxID=1513793 RepID=A0A1Y6CCQ5_9BACT|nr:DUF1415 domain-containing protein [Pseudobacteriovorax antillogorgiicola]TCS48346.1 hypothetical protein EDD56_118126 [Pseudobacteriovorax antillogorgiicola]SMF56323.1 hypothetical protein SAMN06296036_11815 [Pseudobacteriovorax antillogorgiicola]